jgi:hypothetical protein
MLAFFMAKYVILAFDVENQNSSFCLKWYFLKCRVKSPVEKRISNESFPTT